MLTVNDIGICWGAKMIFFEKRLKNILLCQKKFTTLRIENKPYLFILIKQFNFV